MGSSRPLARLRVSSTLASTSLGLWHEQLRAQPIPSPEAPIHWFYLWEKLWDLPVLFFIRLFGIPSLWFLSVSCL
ncbi:hypothetical protein EDB85DRAFT_1202879 [Lactarius pseudohatsudake]|nr:hypothetical protein EDB85DRAFT_1202879 [Lactarius pseudohatsudake]